MSSPARVGTGRKDVWACYKVSVYYAVDFGVLRQVNFSFPGCKDARNLLQPQLMKYTARKAPRLTTCIFIRLAKSVEKSQTYIWTTEVLLAWPTFINATHFPSLPWLFPTSWCCDGSLKSSYLHPSAIQCHESPWKVRSPENQMKRKQKGEVHLSSTSSPFL